MAKDVNKKGIEKKQYPKLIKVGDKKVLVLNPMEEAQHTEIRETTKTKKPAGWGK